MDKYPYIQVCLWLLYFDLTSQHKGKYQPTLMWELHLLVSGNHRLAVDTRIQQNQQKCPIKKNISYVEFTIKRIVYFIIICKLCTTHSLYQYY